MHLHHKDGQSTKKIIKLDGAFLITIIWFVFPIELSSQDLRSLDWVLSYMAHDSIGFSPIPLDVFPDPFSC